VAPRPPTSNPSESADTNPLPKVSSAKAWTALSFPKVPPVIREKPTAPRPPRRVRADGTEEICAEDIMVIVPKASPPRPGPARAKQPSSEELGDADIVVEHAAPQPEQFRPPAYSIHATQEILADDVIEVTSAAVNDAVQEVAPHRDEIPSTLPWTIDAGDDLEFPTPPQYSGPYAQVSQRITNYSATQVFRRRSTNVKVVIASVSLAAAVVLVSGIARLARIAPAAGESGPVGISLHAPKPLDSTVRGSLLAYGTAPHVRETVAVSIDALPTVPHRRVWRRHRR
jgi:hypothetical protein